MAHFHTTTRALLHSTGVPGDIVYCDDEFWLVIANPMRRVPVASLFSGVHQCGRDGSPGSPGPQGERGAPGRDGRDGTDGKDGAQGERGATGERGERGDSGHSPSVEEIVQAVLAELLKVKSADALAADGRQAMIEESKQRAREMARHLREAGS